MAEGLEAGRTGHPLRAAALPFAVALALIVAAGLFAERHIREMAERDLRLAVHAGVEAAARRLETETDARLAALERMGAGLASDVPSRAFASAAADPALSGALAVAGTMPGLPAPLATGGALVSRLADLLADGGLSGSGAAPLDDLPGAALVIWNAETPARVAAAFDLAMLAGAQTPPLALGLAAAGAAPEMAADAAAGGPVQRRVRLAGTTLTLAALPAAGWTVRPPALWTGRLAMLAASLLILGPILRAQRLVAERQRNTRALREREAELDRLSQRLGLALDASKVGVWDFNIDSDELVWDDRMDELYALPRDGRSRVYEDWKRRLHPDDLARAEREFDEAIRVTGRYNSDYRLRLPDGSTRHIRAIGARYAAPDGTSRIVGVNWDVTADVLRSAELEAKRLEAEAASIAKSQFLATMSHEIRTPMNGILGMLDLMLRSSLTPEQARQASIARDSARHLLAILNDVLDFSKLEAHQVVLQNAPTDVAQVARDVVTLLSAGVEPRRLVLRLDIAPDLPRWLSCDATRLRQVLINLIGNAIKFTETGSVDVGLRFEPDPEIRGETDAGGRLRVAVRDTGIGIAREAQHKLFQRFVQIDGSDSRARGGTGLGLAISRQLVELMGGTIAVESAPGQGSTFRFAITAIPCDAPAAAPQRQRGAPPAPFDVALPARILLAEDNRTNQHILSAYLALAGHSVRIVEDGHQAVAAAASEPFDLVLMDIQMPELDGVAAARRIRALDGCRSRVPIIARTAHAIEGYREACLAAGMTDHVTKPVSPDALLAAIARVMARERPAQTTLPDADTGPS